MCYNSVINAWGWSKAPGKAVRAWAVYQRIVDRSNAGVSSVRPDIVGLNSVLNACAFTDVRSEVDRADALRIAVEAFEFVTASKPKYGRPNHISFGTVLMVLVNLLPPGRDEGEDESRERLAQNLFWQCCRGGHLSGMVFSQVFKAVSDETLLELFGEAAVRSPETGKVVIDRRKVPSEWSKHADEAGMRGFRKSRGSKKRPMPEVTKQQLSRNRRQ